MTEEPINIEELEELLRDLEKCGIIYSYIDAEGYKRYTTEHTDDLS